MTKIEWTDVTWNPVTGCSKISDGCKNCYAERMAHRFGWTSKPWTVCHAAENVKVHPERLEQPLKWKKPRRIFVNSMSDLFHEQVPDWFIRKVFQVMGEASHHTFQVLTKRPERMQKLLTEWLDEGDFCTITGGTDPHFPWPNVWLGVSVENQKAADERIPLLLDTPAAVRFLSCEPLLGPVDLERPVPGSRPVNGVYPPWMIHLLDWVIVGGESGPGARPMHPDWVKSIRDQCVTVGVPFFFKQWGEFCYPSQMPDDTWVQVDQSLNLGHYPDEPIRVGKKAAGRLLDGQEWNEMPEVSHIAQTQPHISREKSS